MRFKETAKNLILLLVTLVFLVAGTEVAYRLIKRGQYVWPKDLYENHPVFGYRLRPGARGTARSLEFSFDIAVNSQGLRDIERASYDKPDGVFRILGLGDSFAMGHGVAYEEMFYTLLEKSLQKEYGVSKVDIIKAGTGGWGPVHELVYFEEEGIKYKPDLVLLAFFENDFIDEKSGSLGEGVVRDGYLQSREPKEFSLKSFIFGRMHSWGYMAAKVRALPFFARASKTKEDIHFQIDSTQAEPRNPETKATIAYTFDAVEKIHQAAALQGADFLVVAIPGDYRVDPGIKTGLNKQYGLKPEATDYLLPYRQLERFGVERGFKVLNLGPVIENYQGKVSGDLYFPIDTHFTAGGHALAAEAILNYLEERGLLKIK